MDLNLKIVFALNLIFWIKSRRQIWVIFVLLDYSIDAAHILLMVWWKKKMCWNFCLLMLLLHPIHCESISCQGRWWCIIRRIRNKADTQSIFITINPQRGHHVFGISGGWPATFHRVGECVWNLHNFDHMRFDGSATVSVFSVDGVVARDWECVHCGGVMGEWGEQVNWLKRNVSILSGWTMVL